MALNGKNPTLLTGYGGFNHQPDSQFCRQSVFYGWSMAEFIAVANLRGGAEFGEDWHRAGMLDKKQNVFDDFIAAAEYLISQKYTDKDHLAIQGGSNGGLLVGAAFTQRPDLFRAVVCAVPLLDMLRYQNFQIAKLWIPEYGSAEDAKQFDWLYAYSPYHHVKAGSGISGDLIYDGGERYPGRSDARQKNGGADAGGGGEWTQPGASDSVADRDQGGARAGKPMTKQIEEGTDVYSFLFWQLGVQP